MKSSVVIVSHLFKYPPNIFYPVRRWNSQLKKDRFYAAILVVSLVNVFFFFLILPMEIFFLVFLPYTLFLIRAGNFVIPLFNDSSGVLSELKATQCLTEGTPPYLGLKLSWTMNITGETYW